jgi:endonuclease-3
MTAKDFLKAWPVLKRQVKSLNVPWLENLASFDRDPFKILISCILSLRTQDKTTGKTSERLFDLASNPESWHARCLWTGYLQTNIAVVLQM